MAIMRPPQGVRGGEGPPYGSEVSIFKMIKSIRKWIHFSKIAPFFLPKNPFFLRKPSKNWADFTGISDIFRKIILKFSIFMIPYKAIEIQVDSIIKLRKLSKESSKYSLDRGLLRRISEDPRFRQIFSICIRKSQW